MKILFISSGNNQGLGPLIKAQSDSLKKQGCEIDHFQIKGKGIKGYLKQVRPLKKYLKNHNYDIIHAHYSFCGYVAALAGANPLVVSLMGCDLNAKTYSKYIIRFFIKTFWDAVIIKSAEMKDYLGYDSASIISNGVNLNIFKPINRERSLKKLGWDEKKVHILFAANPERTEKNYRLFEEAINGIRKKRDDLVVHTLVDIPHDLIPIYMNAAHVVALTSLREGSPNVIKEAMACNRAIVSTDVGNVKWMMKGIDGCYITFFEKNDVATKLEKAIGFSQQKPHTMGRKRITYLKLDSKSVAENIMEIYHSIST